MTRALRTAVLLPGLVAAAYGGWLLWHLGWTNDRSAGTWLLGGVLLHDAVLAPVTIAAGLVAVRLAGRRRLAPWVVAVLLLAPVTLLSVPVLGRFGARPTEPSLLDRHYWLGWSALVTLVVACVVAGAALAARRRTPVGGGDDGTGDGGR